MLTINVTYDPSVASAPAGFKTAVSAVVAYFESQFNDPVTVNIKVGFGEVNGQSLGSSALGESITNLSPYSYSQIKTALVNDAKSPDDTSAVASLPASNSDPISGNHSYWLATAEAKALGLPGSGGQVDGYIGFSSVSNIFDYDKSDGISPGKYDFFGTVAHELTEVMGRQMMDGTSFSGSPGYEPLDLFHYSAPGVRAFTGSHPGYFSINGGSTNLDNFNTNSSGDYGDWASSAGNDSFLAFSGSGAINAIMPADLTVMDVLGWDKGQPDLIATNMALSGATISYTISNSNVALAGAAASTAGIYLSADSTITTSDTLVGTKSISSLAVGASDNESLSLTSLTFPDTFAAGTYYIGAVADYNANIAESDETNNASGAVAVILGNSSDNNLSGTIGNDTLIGLGGNDQLDGGQGADTMVGGKGNDTYVVDNAGDLVVENNVSAYTPPAGFTVKGTADFNHDGNLDVVLSNGTVSEFQLLDANGAVISTLPAVTWSTKWALVGTLDYDNDGNADLLYQKVGTTTMEVDYLNGTTYTGRYFDGPGITPDALQPLPGGNEGTDTVQSSIDYTLPSGVENLTLTIGAGNINGTGNALNNVITGNGANNTLTGGTGVDTLTGGAGIDTFVFAAGDTGATSGHRDLITDFTPGTDKIDLTGIDSHFGAGLHAFDFIGTAAFDGQAGELNTIYDAVNNVTILEGDVNGDKVADFGIELAGNVTLSLTDFTAGSLLLPLTPTASAPGQTLNGGPLGDTLSDNGFASVTMIGGKGNDTYVVSNAGDVVTENSGTPYVPPAGFTVKGTADFNHDGNLDVVLSNGTVSEFQLLDANGAVISTLPAVTWSTKWALVGTLDYDNDGNADLLYQKVGTTTMEVDYLNGTTYTGRYFDGPGITPDALQPLPGGNEGTDTVQSSIDYTLPSGVENLTLTIGAGNINGTGNALNNVITGNGANNTLTGGAGVDTLTGNGGADVFVFASGDTGSTSGHRDLITDFTPGTDKIDLTGIDSHFGAGLHAFDFIGTAAFDGQAGELNTIYDAVNNVTILEGDTNGDKVADFGIELAGNVTLSLTDFTAGSLLLPLTPTASAPGQTLNGGPLGDTLSDNGFASVTMIGGKGNDTYVVSNAGDVVTENSGTPYVPPAGFTVKGTADFNHDGNLDVVLSNGTVSEFQLLDANGAVISTLPAVTWSTKWALVGTLDYDNDGNADLLYQKVGTTTMEVDYLNGTTYTGRYFDGPGITPDALQPLPGGNEGTDTVQSSIDYTLPSGVENLTLTGTNPINGTGNALNNVITGNGANNTLTGGAGVDTFVFNPNFGKDTVTDFLPGTDKIQFDNTIFADAASVIANTADDGFGNAIITVDANNTITLHNVTTANLHLSDFHIV